VLDRGLKVSGLTRDGIEVIPSIEVTFKLDTSQVREGEPGSRFGYSRDREKELDDKAAIARAVIGQAVNPNQLAETEYYQMAWNQLPAYLAADLWREYLSKFRLEQLFERAIAAPRLTQAPPEVRVPAKDLTQLSNPVQAGRPSALEDTLAGMLHGLNLMLQGYTRDGDSKGDRAAEPAGSNGSRPDAELKTALEIVNLMVELRLMRSSVPKLNKEGIFVPGSEESREFKLLKDRGIRVLGVSIVDPRFSTKVEEHLESSWTANWLANARAEAERIQVRHSFAQIAGQQQALWKYALDLSRALNRGARDRAMDIKGAARVLLMRSRDFLVRHDRAHQVAGKEREALEEILQWVEMDPK
jgi:hypothetical protein